MRMLQLMTAEQLAEISAGGIDIQLHTHRTGRRSTRRCSSARSATQLGVAGIENWNSGSQPL
jgi:hypothetical protein